MILKKVLTWQISCVIIVKLSKKSVAVEFREK